MGKHKTRSQEEVFVTFMEAHEDFARGFFKGDKVLHEDLWNNLSVELNACGPPEKDVAGWKKAWLDWKANIKRKLLHNKQQLQKTGGGNYNTIVLTNAEETVARLCGLYTSVDGIRNTKSYGAPNKENIHVQQPLTMSGTTEMCLTAVNRPTLGPVQPPHLVSSSPTMPSTSAMPSTSTQMPTVSTIETTINISPLERRLPVPHSPPISLRHLLSSPLSPQPPPAKRRRIATELCDIMDMETKNFQMLGEKLDKLCECREIGRELMESIKKSLDELNSLKREELEELKRHHLQMELRNSRI